jgi:beta-lactamase class A
MQRRTFFTSGLAALLLQRAVSANAALADNAELAAIERRAGGRLGVYAFDAGSGRAIAHRANERFPMCSTFKLLAVGAVLARADAGADDLSRRVAIMPADILAYAPVTKAHLNGSMTIAELCAAAIEWSDNTAANLLLHSLAGPAGVTRFARTIGDRVTRLDRNEPTLNTAIPGDPRDTTTPFAMAHDMQTLMLGTALKPASRARLKRWLLSCRTGANKLRRGFPASWREGDKTGSGDNATANDVAIVWPPGRAPLIVAAYFTNSHAPGALQDAALPDVARVVAKHFG